MASHAEVQRILAAQPLSRMQRFADLLGWRGLRLEHVCPREDQAAGTSVPGGVVIFYQTTDEKFNLQINTYPHGQCEQHQATVKAERYGIPHVGWHWFELFDDDERLRQEADRLRPWVDRRLFRDANRRRQFVRAHPEIARR